MYPIDVLYRGATINPQGIALETAEGRLTYTELVARVAALAAAFQELAGPARTRIGICCGTNANHAIAYLAVLASGHVHVPLNPKNGPVELDAFIDVTEPGLLVVDADCLNTFSPNNIRKIIGRGGSGPDSLDSLADRYAGRRPTPLTYPLETVQSVKFTGGSTGRPKGVQQTYRTVNTLIQQMLLTFGFNGADCFLGTTPITHAAGTYLLPMLATGARTILLDQPDPDRILDALENRGVTCAFMPPTLIYKLVDVARASGRTTFPDLRLLMYGAAAMPPDRIRAAQGVFGPVIGTVYGQTEAPMMIAAMAPAEMVGERLASVGRPCLPLRVEVMDDANRILPRGEAGEVVVRGDLLMSGYLNNPEANAATIIDGWLHTGDIGVIDHDGFLFLKDRKRDVIITGGFNVYPSDVEAILVRHPAVHEAVVFALPDDKWGERVEAAVQLKPGASVGDAELAAFVKAALGAIKTPKRLHVIADLPRNSLGKVLRREVRAAFAEK